jgi:hypothetical protein
MYKNHSKIELRRIYKRESRLGSDEILMLECGGQYLEKRPVLYELRGVRLVSKADCNAEVSFLKELV